MRPVARARVRLLVATAGLGLGVALPAVGQAPWPTREWAVTPPQAQGLAPAALTALRRQIEAGTYGLVDRLVVVRDGYLVMNERYHHDYRIISRGVRGPLGCGIDACTDSSEVHLFNYLHPDYHPYYQGRDVHSLQSVTKSVSSALIGIAIRRGDITGTDATLLSFLDDYDLSRVDPRLREATLDDLLTMRSGIEWHETDRPADSTNTTFQLEAAEDWVQFTLDQPMDAAPGSKWAYNSGTSHLMSAVLRRATGQTADTYAATHLFGPLGIEDFHWKKTPRGLPDTEGGLYLEAADLAKVGLLYLRDGVWDGQRILPEGWVAASTQRRVERVNGAGWGYGLQWWRIDRDGVDVWAALGFGGQFLIVIPSRQLVGVINSWTLFGTGQSGVLGPFVDALLAASGS
ncbi:MAG TPA: serine hydrolase [Gemmatimonadales bacterium]